MISTGQKMLLCVFIYSFACSFLTFVYFLPFTFSRDSRSFFCSLLKLENFMLLERLIMQTHHKKAALNFKLLMFSLFVHTHSHAYFMAYLPTETARTMFFFLMFCCLSSSPSFPSTIVELYWWLESCTHM